MVNLDWWIIPFSKNYCNHNYLFSSSFPSFSFENLTLELSLNFFWISFISFNSLFHFHFSKAFYPQWFFDKEGFLLFCNTLKVGSHFIILFSSLSLHYCFLSISPTYIFDLTCLFKRHSASKWFFGEKVEIIWFKRLSFGCQKIGKAHTAKIDPHPHTVVIKDLWTIRFSLSNVSQDHVLHSPRFT